MIFSLARLGQLAVVVFSKKMSFSPQNIFSLLFFVLSSSTLIMQKKVLETLEATKKLTFLCPYGMQTQKVQIFLQLILADEQQCFVH